MAYTLKGGDTIFTAIERTWNPRQINVDEEGELVGRRVEAIFGDRTRTPGRADVNLSGSHKTSSAGGTEGD